MAHNGSILRHSCSTNCVIASFQLSLYCGFAVELDCDQVTVSYERFRKVCPQCNTVVHAMEFSRSMRLRKVCLQYSYRSACEEVSLWLWPCLRIEEKESTLYCHWGAWERRKVLLSELLVTKQGDKVCKELLKHVSRQEQNLGGFICQHTVEEHGLPSFLHRRQSHYCTVDAGAAHGSIHVIDILYLLMTPFLAILTVHIYPTLYTTIIAKS